MFLKNNFNFYINSFFFLKNYNLYLFFISSKNNIFSNIVDKKKINFNNSFSLNHFSKNFLLKYVKYFNKIIMFNSKLIKINQLSYFYSYKNNKFFFFNKFNYFYVDKVLKLLLQINFNNYNFLILDSNFKNYFPIYNYIYGLNNLLIYKKYFFIKSSFFTYNN